MRHVITLGGVHRLAGALRSEAGFTLIELVVAMSILIVVITALTGGLISATNSQANASNRFQAQEQGRLALSKLTRRSTAPTRSSSRTGAP